MINKQRVLEILADTGIDYHSYSGRGMFGDRCLAITCENPFVAIGDIVKAVESVDDIQLIGFLISGAKTDSLGREYILYFPDVEYSDASTDEEEEEN
jgi:hypothetical protein